MSDRGPQLRDWSLDQLHIPDSSLELIQDIVRTHRQICESEHQVRLENLETELEYKVKTELLIKEDHGPETWLNIRDMDVFIKQHSEELRRYVNGYAEIIGPCFIIEGVLDFLKAHTKFYETTNKRKWLITQRAFLQLYPTLQQPIPLPGQYFTCSIMSPPSITQHSRLNYTLKAILEIYQNEFQNRPVEEVPNEDPRKKVFFDCLKIMICSKFVSANVDSSRDVLTSLRTSLFRA